MGDQSLALKFTVCMCLLQEIEKRYKDEIETLRKELEALRVADKMKKMTERQKQEQKANIFDVLVSENASLVSPQHL